MTSSSSDSTQTAALSSTACVYLLRSATENGKFKLGITNHLADRIDSLRKSHGPVDLSNSVLIAAKDRRTAFDLEGVLKAVFDAPAWRSESASKSPKPVRVRVCNGESEWYAIKAFEPMIAFIEEVMRRDESCGNTRFKLERGTEPLEKWCRRTRSAIKQRRLSGYDIEVDASERLEESEANFRHLQTWMESRRHRLINVRPSLPDREQTLGRIFLFQTPPDADPEANEFSTGECEDLASMCLVSYRSKRGFGSFSYLGGLSMSDADPTTYTVELIVTTSFERAATECPMLDDLLARIKTWLCVS